MNIKTGYHCEGDIVMSAQWLTYATAPFMGVSAICVVMSLTLFEAYVLGYTNDQQLHHQCHLMTLGAQVCLLIFWHEYVQ